MAEVSSSKLRGLVEAGLAVSSAGSLRDTLRVVTDQAREVIGAHQALTTFRLDPSARIAIGALSLSDKYAAYRTYDESPDGSGIYRLVCERNQSFRMTQEELERHPAFRHFGAAAGRHPPLRGWLAVPLVSRGGENLGVIQLSDKYSGEFTEQDQSLLEQFARLAAVVAENARLHEEREHLLARERAARAEAEAAVRARDVFVSVASHELRTPLTTLRLQVDALSRAATGAPSGASGRPLDARLAVVRRQIDRLELLIGELLDVSRISAGGLVLRIEPVDLTDVVREVIGRFTEAGRSAGSAISLDAPGPIVGRWDRMRLDQVTTNLLSNALKYGAGQPIAFQLAVGGGRARLNVRDRGIGIAREQQARLFQPFERLVSERHYGGLGLGLWITRRIVERMSGSIRVESERGEGSTFIVELPLDAPA